MFIENAFDLSLNFLKILTYLSITSLKLPPICLFLLNFPQQTLFFLIISLHPCLKIDQSSIQEYRNMKVTRRLPIHGQFTGSPDFLEMRYFRLQDNSFYLAVFFGLFEEANFPQSKMLRERLVKEKNRASEDRNILEFLLDEEIKPEIALAAWNYEGFYSHVMRACGEKLTPGCRTKEEFVGKIKEKLGVRVVGIGEVGRCEPGDVVIVCEEVRDGVVLLYRHWGVDSIVITPCGHIFTKWAIFTHALQSMSQPFTSAEFTERRFLCSCQEDISSFVFHIGVRDAQSVPTRVAEEICTKIWTDSYFTPDFQPYRRDIPYDRCGYCAQERGVTICKQQHRMCIKCIAGLASTRHQFHCVQCHEKIDYFKKEEVVDCLRQSSYVTDTSRITVTCEGCRVECDIVELEESWKSSHKCLLCTTCRLTQGGRCPSCAGRLLEENVVPVTGGFYVSETIQRQICTKCSYPRELYEFGRYLENTHGCFVCDRCIETGESHGIGWCPLCHENERFIERDNRGRVFDLRLKCTACRTKKNKSAFAVMSQLSHWWKCCVCDLCLANRMPGDLCLHFGWQYLSSNDAKLLSRIQVNAERPRLACELCTTKCDLTEFSVTRAMNHACQICNTCWKKQYKSAYYNATCHKCYVRFDADAENDFLAAVRELMTEEVFEYKYVCRKCMEVKGKLEMLTGLQLKHRCRICDRCLQRYPDSTDCQICREEYAESDLILLNRAHLRKQCSSCGKPFSQKMVVKCYNACQCGLCLAKFFLLTEKTQCSKCTGSITGHNRMNLACSNCQRSLYGDYGDMKFRVTGICDNLHVLCCYCIRIVEFTQRCPICDETVTEKTTSVKVAALQREDDCLVAHQKHHNISTLECQTMMDGRTYSCRQCRYELKVPAKPKTLTDFIPSS